MFMNISHSCQSTTRPSFVIGRMCVIHLSPAFLDDDFFLCFHRAQVRENSDRAAVDSLVTWHEIYVRLMV